MISVISGLGWLLGVIGFFFALKAKSKSELHEFLLVQSHQKLDELSKRIATLEVRNRDSVEPSHSVEVQNDAKNIQAAQAVSEQIETPPLVQSALEQPKYSAKSEAELAATSSISEAELMAAYEASVGQAGSETEPSTEFVTAPAPPTMPEPAPVATRSDDMERKVATRWTVWIGALALALGGVFMVKFSIEQGYFGPGARIVMGAIFAALLLAGGEFFRRHEVTGRLPFAPDAPIPALLTAAGSMTAFAVCYAATIFDFMSPGTAFIIMGIVSLCTMMLAALHGPSLAALGLLGGFAVPVLVSSRSENYLGLVAYLTVVTLASYGLARLRNWKWLAIATAIGAGLWGVLLLRPVAAATPEQVYIVVQMLLAAFFLVIDRHDSTDEETTAIDPLASLTIAGFGLLGIVAIHHTADGFYTYAGLLILLQLALSYRYVAISPSAVVASALLILTLLSVRETGSDYGVVIELFSNPLTQGQLSRTLNAYLGFATIASLALLGCLGWRVWKTPILSYHTALIYIATATLSPLIALVICWWRVREFGVSPGFAAASGVLALIFAGVTSRFWQRGPRSIADAIAIEAFAACSIAALALGLTMALEQGGLTVAFALSALGAAWVTTRGPIGSLKIAVGVLAALVLARLAWNPEVVTGLSGSAPIFNWLLLGYGVPALAFWQAAKLIRRQASAKMDIRIADIALSASLLLSALLLFFEIRHWFHGSVNLAQVVTDNELGILVLAASGFAAAMTYLNINAANMVFVVARYAAFVFGSVMAMALAGTVVNASRAGTSLGQTPIFNWLIYYCGLPALYFWFSSKLLRYRQESETVHEIADAAQAVSLFLVALLVVFEIRHWLYDGEILKRSTSHIELGIQAIASIGFSSAMTYLNTRRPSIIFKGARLLSLFSGGAIALLGLITTRNPAFNGQEIVSGGIVINSLLIGYALPTLVTAIYALTLRANSENLLARAAGAMALALGFLWISLVIRHGFNPDAVVLDFPIEGAELWTYSAAWLGIGVLLLAAGLWLNLRDLRLASAAFVTLVTAKVFLLDMSGLEGIWRAASFIGLGLVLMGIGLVYSKVGIVSKKT